MTPSTQRVERYRKAQTERGKRLLTTWVSPEALKRLRELSKGRSFGEAIEDLLTVSKNGQTVT